MHRSPLYDFHVSLGAKMVDFAGWHLPVYYRSINEEHIHTRTNVSAFDVSHMGRVRIDGDDARAFLQRICTRNLDGTAVGQSKYSHICNERGGVLDDVIVSRHADHWLVVCNAVNREKIIAWLIEHAAGTVDVIDQTFDTAMVALQGPAAIGFMENSFGLDLKSLKRFGFIDGSIFGMKYTICRSGYTGEEGVEAIVPARAVKLLLPRLFGDSSNADGECRPAGLGARDTLRLEAAMPLYGHEISEEVDSLTAGQGWCVDLSVDFIGAQAMRKIREEGLKRRLVGLELEGKRIARQGYDILEDATVVGRVTSGTMSPTLQKSIAMGFVEIATAETGTEVAIDMGRKQNPAKVVPLPFYKRPKP